MRLSEDAEHDNVTIEVADDGVGLPIERHRLVEPYMTTRSRGTGLGLAIVKKIVEEHFGTVTFTDREVGGTKVTMTRSEEHTSELQSLMRISYAVFCLKKKKRTIEVTTILLLDVIQTLLLNS